MRLSRAPDTTETWSMAPSTQSALALQPGRTDVFIRPTILQRIPERAVSRLVPSQHPLPQRRLLRNPRQVLPNNPLLHQNRLRQNLMPHPTQKRLLPKTPLRQLLQRHRRPEHNPMSLLTYRANSWYKVFPKSQNSNGRDNYHVQVILYAPSSLLRSVAAATACTNAART